MLTIEIKLCQLGMAGPGAEAGADGTRDRADAPSDEARDPDTSSLRDFKLLRKLGSGSFGSVHCVERLESGRLYAMKQIDISDLSTAEQT